MGCIINSFIVQMKMKERRERKEEEIWGSKALETRKEVYRSHLKNRKVIKK